jgi:hypothetical protein
MSTNFKTLPGEPKKSTKKPIPVLGLIIMGVCIVLLTGILLAVFVFPSMRSAMVVMAF